VTYVWTPAGYRLVCEATGALSAVVAVEPANLDDVEWYSDTADGDAALVARQRAKAKYAMVERGMSEDAAEMACQQVRWDLLPGGRPTRQMPTPEHVTAAEHVERGSRSAVL
jgi:hypothetical protein